jgi:hypothetical protein
MMPLEIAQQAYHRWCKETGIALDPFEAQHLVRVIEATISAEYLAMSLALKPFALAIDGISDGARDTDHLWESAAAMSLTAGDLRRAASSLARMTSKA